MEITNHAAGAAGTAPADVAALRRRAGQLEALLFSEMLRASGTGSPRAPGGQESPFEDFLRTTQAEAVAADGRTGLTEAILRSLMRRAG